MLELTDSLVEKGISVMEFSAKHSMYQLGYPYETLHKIHISYVTESCVATVKGAEHTGEVFTICLK